jgi:hypothetical protein
MNKFGVCPLCTRHIRLVVSHVDTSVILWRKHRTLSDEVCVASRTDITEHAPSDIFDVDRSIDHDSNEWLGDRRKQQWTPERRARLSASRKALFENPEFRARNIETKRRLASNPEITARRIAASQAAAADPAVRAKIAATWQDPEIRARRIAGLKRSHSTPETVARLSASAKAKWRDPEYREKIMKTKT